MPPTRCSAYFSSGSSLECFGFLLAQKGPTGSFMYKKKEIAEGAPKCTATTKFWDILILHRRVGGRGDSWQIAFFGEQSLSKRCVRLQKTPFAHPAKTPRQKPATKCSFCPCPSLTHGLSGQFNSNDPNEDRPTSLRFLVSGLPKGPSRTKNTTDSKFTIRSKFATAIVKHYGGHFETTNVKGN